MHMVSPPWLIILDILAAISSIKEGEREHPEQTQPESQIRRENSWQRRGENKRWKLISGQNNKTEQIFFAISLSLHEGGRHQNPFLLSSLLIPVAPSPRPLSAIAQR